MNRIIWVLIPAYLIFLVCLPDGQEVDQLSDITTAPALLGRTNEDIAILDSAANQTYPSTYLKAKYGDTLESRIRYWFELTGRELSQNTQITLVTYKFEQGDTVRQEIGNPNSETGKDTISALIYGNHVFVVVSNDPEYDGEYMLRCMNGMVDSPSVESIAAEDVNDGVKIINPGGSLCGTLDLTWQEARDLANQEGLENYWRKGIFYVIIQPGDRFVLNADGWRLENLYAGVNN